MIIIISYIRESLILNKLSSIFHQLVNTLKEKDIVVQISRILGSARFKNSRILSDFLHYIVSETLASREQNLKEYVIATHVLKKDIDFNPQLDAIVRIHARRLRSHLDEYYREEGINDRIKISVPKGRYIPLFENNNAPEPSLSVEILAHIENNESKPVVAVLPLKKVQKNDRIDVICSVFCQDLSVELSHFPEIGVVSNYSIQHACENLKDEKSIVSYLNVDFVLTGACYIEGNNIRINIELNAVKEERIVWAENFSIEDYQNNDLINYRTIIRKVIASTCGFFGFIYRNTLNAHVPNEFDHLYAIYWHNRYHKQFSEEAFHEAMNAVDIGLKNNPTNSLLIAFKAELYLNLLALDIQGEVDFLKLGLELLKQAIAIDPMNQHTYQVLAWAKMLSHDKKGIDRAIEKCLSINPNNAMYSGSVGFGYVCSGEYKKGLDLMAESIILNPYYHWNVNVGFCLYYIHENEYDEALYWAEKINKRKLLWDPLLRVALFGLLNRKDEAKEVTKDLLLLSPHFLQRARIITATFILDIELQNALIEGLMMSGLNIPND